MSIVWRKRLPHLIAEEAAGMFAHELDAVTILWEDYERLTFKIDSQPDKLYRAEEVEGGWQIVEIN